MAKSKYCPKCKTERPEAAIEGLCPKCMLAAGMQSVSDHAQTEDPTIDTKSAGHSSGDTGSVPIPGQSVAYFGDYELLEEIARGGMGVVFKARQTSLNRIVAVKMILAGQLASDVDVQRFRIEAEAAANLQHHNIVAIHEVGEHNGQHYFSMDYVQGRSLADVIRENLLSARQSAQYVKAIAEAIQYAHENGTLHRDLKPSNVLIDQNDQPRITDFGLAKRIDSESEVTATGQALGTPSYMPPEQAAGKRHAIGPASEVYSIGAILYELLTGRPPFRAETPLDTILQVLDTDPAPPRLLNPNVPRDLETICLKCLEKVPTKRYPSAARLGDDVGRFLAGESIEARRPRLAEQVLRWLRKQRRSVAVAAVAVFISVLLMLGGIGSWLGYSQWRLGHISLDTDGPALSAEVLDESDRLVVPRFTMPTQQPVPIPKGSYRMRLAGPRHMSETFLTQVQRGAEQRFTIRLGELSRWESIQVPRSCEVMELDGRAGLILLTEQGIRRLNGATTEVVWEMDLDPETQPLLAHTPGFTWNWFTDSAFSGKGPFDRRPQFVQPAPDVDGDHVDDLLLACRHQATLLAISGKQGTLLWCRRALHASGQDVDMPSASTIVGLPVLADVDGVGAPDLIATCSSLEGARTVRWIEAVSGSTGKLLWQFRFDDSWFPASQVPDSCQWFPGADGGPSSQGGGRSGGSTRMWTLRSGPARFVPYAGEVAVLDGQPVVVVMAGTHLVGLDAGTGDPVWQPRDLRAPLVRSPLLGDLEGDGGLEALLLREPADGTLDLTALHITKDPWPALGTNRASIEQSLVLPGQLWQTTLRAWWYGFSWHDDLPDWPLLVDLDGDLRPEVVVPNRDATDPAVTRGIIIDSPWGGLDVLDGATGQVRWHRRLNNMRYQHDRFTVGDDIDGDGHRELFVASLVDHFWGSEVEGFSMFVDALSGQDGHTVWWQQQRLRDPSGGCDGLGIGRLAWGSVAADGWPQLVVPYSAGRDQHSSNVYFLSAGTGRLLGIANDFTHPRVVDLDRDGAQDVYAFQPNHHQHFDHGGTLHAFWPSPKGEWRRLGVRWQAVRDLDGDGCQDLVKVAGGSLTSISGRDGRLLWQSRADSRALDSPPLPHGDLNGDGTPDLIGRVDSTGMDGGGRSVLHTFSGSSGKKLWSTEPVTTWAGVQLAEPVDLDADGQSEVVLVAATDPTSRNNMQWQWWVTVLSGPSGQVIWSQPLSERNQWNSFFQKSPIGAGIDDLDGDAVLDLVLPVITPEMGYQLRAFSGRDGRILWQRPLTRHASNQSLLHHLPNPLVGDLDGDGTSEVVVIDYDPDPTMTNDEALAMDSCKVLVLDGDNGQLKWDWSWRDAGVRSNPNDRPQLLLANLDGDGKRSVCLSLISEEVRSQSSLIILDAFGKIRAQRAIESEGQPRRVSPVSHDLDGNGKDELLFFDGDTLLATRDGLQRPLWEWRLPGGRNQRVEIQEQATVIVRSGDDIYGLDGLTGSVTWHYRGLTRDPILLRTSEPGGFPRVVESVGDRTISRAVVSAVNEGSLPRPTRTVFGETVSDPRLSRVLPWTRNAETTLYQMIFCGTVSVVVLVVPGLFLISSLRRGSWSLLRLLSLPLCLAVVLGCVRFAISMSTEITASLGRIWGPLMFHGPEAGEALSDPIDLVLMALQGLPLILLPGLALFSLVKGKWKRIAAWLMVYLVVALAMGGIVIWQDASRMDPAQHYSWNGWYWLLFFAIYATGMLLAVVLLLKPAARFFWRRVATRLSKSIVLD